MSKYVEVMYKVSVVTSLIFPKEGYQEQREALRDMITERFRKTAEEIGSDVDVYIDYDAEIQELDSSEVRYE